MIYNIFLTTIIILIAAGLTSVLFLLAKREPGTKTSPIHLHSVIMVKDDEETIEGVIRSFAWKTQNSSTDFRDIFVVDLGSKDKTFFILEKLKEEYTFIHPIKKTDYVNYISKL